MFLRKKVIIILLIVMGPVKKCDGMQYPSNNSHKLSLNYILLDKEPDSIKDLPYNMPKIVFSLSQQNESPNKIVKSIRNQRDYENNRIYACIHCPYTTQKKHEVQTHINRHAPFVCSYCNKQITQLCNLYTHISYKHTNERPYTCKYCNRSFVKKFKLNCHIRYKHTGEKPYMCPYEACFKGFAEKPGLNNHIQRHHTGERPKVCPYCSKSFVKKGELNRHIKYKH